VLSIYKSDILYVCTWSRRRYSRPCRCSSSYH